MKRSTIAVLSVASAGLLLSACGGNDAAETTTAVSTATVTSAAQAETTTEATETTTIVSESPEATTEENSGDIRDVDAEQFATGNGQYVFSYTVDGFDGTCFIKDEGVACTGTPRDDAPEVQMDPFPRQRAGAVAASNDGLYYTVFEGVPPAKGKLEPGQRVVAAGTECVAYSPQKLRCVAHDRSSFSITAPNGMMQPEGQLLPRYEVQ